MPLSRNRPEILSLPEHPPACCTQQTITAGPDVAEKTRQKHDYPSQAGWRTSYQRRTAAERLNATIKNPAVNSIDRSWIRLTGLTPLMLWLTCLIAVRNQRTLIAYHARQDDNRAAPPPDCRPAPASAAARSPAPRGPAPP